MRYLMGLLAVLACGGATENSPPPPPPANYSIGVIEADSVAPVGTTTRVVVEVLNIATSAPAPGVLVNFVVVHGGGSVFAGTGLTDSLGRVRDIWSLGTVADTQVLEARAVDPATGDPIVYARAVVRAAPGAITSATLDTTAVRVFVGDSVSLGARTFTAADQYGNAIDTAVTWNPSSNWVVRNAWLVNLGAATDSLRWSIGPVTGSIRTSAVPSLFEGQTYSITFACERVGGAIVQFAGSVDQVSYQDSPTYNPLIGGVVQVRFTVQDSLTLMTWSATQRVTTFTPDSLVYETTQNNPLGIGRVQGTTVTGGDWCWAISYQYFRALPATLTRN